MIANLGLYECIGSDGQTYFVRIQAEYSDYTSPSSSYKMWQATHYSLQLDHSNLPVIVENKSLYFDHPIEGRVNLVPRDGRLIPWLNAN